MTLNRVHLIGRLGADPELRSTQKGTPVANMRLATNRTWRDDNGETQEDTEWHRIVVFGSQAEACDEYLEKGRQVYVEGRLQTREWDDDNGNTRYTTEIVASSVQFLSGGADGGGGGSGGPPPPSGAPGGFDDPSDSPDDEPFDDEEIPF